MIKKGANDWDYGLEGACFGGNKEIAILMIKKGATQVGLFGKNAREGFKDYFGEYPPN